VGAGLGAVLGAWTADRADPAAAFVIVLAGLGIILANRTFWVRQAGLGLATLGLIWVRVALGPALTPAGRPPSPTGPGPSWRAPSASSR